MIELLNQTAVKIGKTEFVFDYDSDHDTLHLFNESYKESIEVTIDCFGLMDFVEDNEHYVSYTHASSPQEVYLSFKEVDLKAEWIAEVLEGWVKDGDFITSPLVEVTKTDWNVD